MMPLEVQRRRRDDAVRVVERRPARRLFQRYLRILIEEARGLFVLRAGPVRADCRTERLWFDGRRLCLAAAGHERGAPGSAEAEEPPPGAGGRVLHGGYFTHRF